MDNTTILMEEMDMWANELAEFIIVCFALSLQTDMPVKWRVQEMEDEWKERLSQI